MVGDTPIDTGYENGVGMGNNGMVDLMLVVAVSQEVMNMFKG
ncbi:hypothetical protein Tco_0616931, partial [Tanacetum coccineum]